MNLLILGATGPTGQQLVKQATEHQHEITALVRSPEKLQTANQKLTALKGDVLNEYDVAKAVAGKDAVVSALGVGASLISHDLIFNAISNLIPAMQQARVGRLVMLSAFGVGETYEQANFLQKFAFKFPLKDIYRDKGKADALIRNSGLDWTLVCPVKLTNGAFTGKYKAGEKFSMTGFPSISRADVAYFMIAQLGDDTYLKKTVVLKK